MGGAVVRVAVVGGGVAGLAAAHRLRELLGPAAQITVYDQATELGGKLRTGSLAGLVAERGAESFLVRSPGGDSAAVALARRVGLGHDLVHPRPLPAGLWCGGELRPLPAGTLLGVPGDFSRLAGVARPAGDDRDTGRPVLGPGEDPTVGDLVRRRFGDEVADRLVDPMLGGVYAGRADSLSLSATMPGLAAACRTHTTLAAAVRAALAAAPRPAGTPVFATLRGGLGRLVAAVSAASGAELRTGRPVRQLTSTGAGWRLLVGSTRDAEPVAADAVVLAVPARPAGRLLRGVDPATAEAVGRLDYASVALVTMALPPATPLPELSGFLVPATEGTLVKAATFLTRKWAHLGAPDGPVLVRASVGRYGETGPLRQTDADLGRRVHAELARMVGGLPAPLSTHVQRWGGALPQYPPGHLDRVAAARTALPGTLGLAGAAYDGVGIPACVTSGQAAAAQVTAALEESKT